MLNNKFRAQNLNMNINIHYNAKGERYKGKMFDEGVVIKKGYKVQGDKV